MAKTTLSQYRNNLETKSVKQAVALAQTLGNTMRVSAFKVAMICAHCTDATTKGAISQNEFACQAEISKGTLSDIMKAYRLIVAEGDDTMALFLDGSVQFKYNVISRYANKVDISLVELCSLTQREVQALVENKGEKDNKGEKSDKATLVAVTDEHGNKYLVPAEILAKYAQ